MRIQRYRNRLISHLHAVAVLLLFLAISASVVAQTASNRTQPVSNLPALSVSSVATKRFVAVHGRRAVVMGYPEQGLEFWAYPLQLLSGYQISFRSDGAATETDARSLLSRVIETPDSVTRIYAGSDYVVREKLFVPLDQPAAFVSYEVKAAHPIEIVIHWTPVLDLMWPAALGGQSTQWNSAMPGYVMTEPAHGLTAIIGSAQIASHDATVNSALRASGELSFSIRPVQAEAGNADASALADVVIGQMDTASQDPVATQRSLIAHKAAWETDAAAHYAMLQQNALRIHTPDDAVNAALAWSAVALDQSWVCDPKLGCGLVAGYGPSRPGRRPQYAWFFAGDGLVATNALISAGAFTRAREELEFIVRYQDQKTGMIWHELTLSAKYIDWVKYAYMYVHVDISFAYLTTLARYVAASGDTNFVATHWSSIAAAYAYCRSLIHDGDHLPHVPADKEAGDEQHRPADDLGLSTSWVEASRSFAELAQASGHAELADEALKQGQLTQHAIAAHYWDAKHQFWIGSHSATGEPIFSRGSGPGGAIGEHIFSPEQNEQILDQIASAKFQTDWGTRSVASDSSIYAPWSYATGSIFALHSAMTAQTYWQAHRPDIAWSIWRTLLPWTTLDAPGHIHEVLAGNYFRAQTESVPEQTWSSAGLLDTAVRGLFGIDVHAAQNSLTLRPHLPAEWEQVSVENIRLPKSNLAFSMHHDVTGVDLEIRNDGAPVAVAFEPEIPLGAEVVGAEFAGEAIAATVERSGEDAHAKLQFTAPVGVSRCHFRLLGGVSLILPEPAPQIGDASSAMKLTNLRLQERNLFLNVDINPAGANGLRIQTPWKIISMHGATLEASPDGASATDYQVQIQTPKQITGGYASTQVEIQFAQP